MKFFIDTANIAQIKEAKDLGILDGVTTNPSLMAKEGIKGEENILEHYVKICAIVKGDVSAEVISTDYKSIIAEGKILATTKDVTKYILDEAKVAVVPFYAFGTDDNSSWYRLSVGTCKMEDVDGAITGLRNALKKLS